NILLIALIILSTTAFLINFAQSIYYTKYIGENPFTTGLISFVFILLLFISRKGKSQIASFILVFSLVVISIYVSSQWGADSQANLLLFAFIIVMAGILLGTIPAFITTAFVSIAIILFSYLEILSFIHPKRTEGIRIADSFVNVIILTIIAIVSWLSNRETEKSLKRARASEKELKKERDQLEIKVEERTRELKQAQLEKMTQLHRFAEIGRLTSGFLHDLVSP